MEKLSKKQMVLISFMLFSLFFGAGNLIFPTFLGYNSGNLMPLSLLGFFIPSIILPVLGVIIVAKFNGLQNLASQVHPVFAIIFTIVIFLSIGPGLGIPRAASVPFEMAIKPYINTDKPWIFMLIYSLVFFLIALWLALNPNKLVERIGHFLTPTLLGLLVIVFITFLFKGEVNITGPSPIYQKDSFLVGFIEGYQTMDTIASLNFGLVIATTLFSMGIKDKKVMTTSTIKAGLISGTILMVIYSMLAFMGMAESGTIEGAQNGAEILRSVVYQLFGDFGAILVALIFTLACLTTCVGLITSISQYFSSVIKKIPYKWMVILITTFSFVICNFGLNTILEVSIPVLNAIYPISIVLILLGLFNKFYKHNQFIYPLTIGLTGLISIVYALDGLIDSEHTFSFLSTYLPGYSLGFGWVFFSLIALILSFLLSLVFINKKQYNEFYKEKKVKKSQKKQCTKC